MKVLVSPASLDEARLLIDLGVHIIDVKNPAEGSLGAALPSVVRDIADYSRSRGVPSSATLGDLPFKPGTAALAAFGLARLCVNYVKAGLYGPRTLQDAVEMLRAMRDAVAMVDETIAVVAASYADYRTFDGLSPSDLVTAAAATGCTTVLIDTLDKQAGSLFEWMGDEELRRFIESAREARLAVALAGSIRAFHLPALIELGPDIIGVRGALCSGHDRRQQIDRRLVEDFLGSVRRRTRPGGESAMGASASRSARADMKRE